jgi:hypothetical protein
MNRDLALTVLGQIMDWDNATAQKEFNWLALMSRLKYDGYRGFIAGARFLESLTYWLQQFPQEDRAAAYEFLRDKLIYICPEELQHLVELAYPDVVEPILWSAVAASLGVPKHTLLANTDAVRAFRVLLRKSLFLGLSDGARIDSFRRANEGLISNDQIATATEIHPDKWASMLRDLQADKNVADKTATFEFVFLIDDLVASGTTLLRQDAESKQWDGKLKKFLDSLGDHLGKAIHPQFRTIVHHYLASARASENIADRAKAAGMQLESWYPSIDFTFGFVLPEACHHNVNTIASFAPLAEKYYDPAIETASIRRGGTDARYGFAAGGLALILEHNTPNNSIGLLWAESHGDGGAHPMRPLFRRRQRHS